MAQPKSRLSLGSVFGAATTFGISGVAGAGGGLQGVTPLGIPNPTPAVAVRGGNAVSPGGGVPDLDATGGVPFAQTPEAAAIRASLTNSDTDPGMGKGYTVNLTALQAAAFEGFSLPKGYVDPNSAADLATYASQEQQYQQGAGARQTIADAKPVVGYDSTLGGTGALGTDGSIAKPVLGAVGANFTQAQGQTPQPTVTTQPGANPLASTSAGQPIALQSNAQSLLTTSLGTNPLALKNKILGAPASGGSGILGL